MGCCDAGALRYGLLGLGVLAMIAFLPRLFRRFRAKEPQSIAADELRRRLTAGDPLMILDVRQPDEFSSPPGHLPGAVNVSLGELTDRTSDLARRDQPIVVVGWTAIRKEAALISARSSSPITVIRKADLCRPRRHRHRHSRT
jgi:rhodanese-related sulfurtransferase